MGLDDLWGVSLALSALSLTIMAALIVTRFVHERRQRTMAHERARLLPLLLDPGRAEELLAWAARPQPLLIGLSVELIGLVRGEDRELLVAAASRHGVAEGLRSRLGSRSARTRISAAEALTWFTDAFTTDALERALEDPHSHVRLTAAMALTESGRAPPLRFLIGHLGLGTRENSMLIAGLLKSIAADRPDEVKALIADPGVPTPVKAAAIEALSSTGDYGLVPVINELALATDAMNEDLPRFLRALGAFHHPAGAPAVRRWLTGRAWWVRAAAAEAAGRIGLQDVAGTLAAMLDDPDWWVRFRAGEALVRLGPSGRALLVAASRNSAEPARSAARLTMAEQGLPG